MNPGYKIIWTDEASQNVDDVITYLENNWGQQEANNFIVKLKARISLISKHPDLFQKTELFKNVRRSVLTKQNTIYYRLENDHHIEILSVFDTRQAPEKLSIT